ncbi:MAG: tetratricopeptide repeat protein [Isosphaeraceae bacterium]
MAGSEQTRKSTSVPEARSLQFRRAGLILAALTVLLVLVGAIGWIVRERRRIQELAAATRAAVARHDLAQAQTLIDRWIEARPGDGEPHALCARINLIRHDPAKVIESLDRAAERQYDPAAIALTRAILIARSGRSTEAIPILQRAFATPGPLDPEVADALVRAYLSSFQFGPAAYVLARWIKEVPDDARPYLYRNEIDQRSDATADVMIANYRMALQRDPNLDKARLGLADKLRDSQRSDEAEVEYQAYLERHPQSVEAHVGAGQIALRKGELAKAVEHFEAALRVDPKEPVALRELALIDVRSGAYDRACRRLETVIQVDPYDPEVHLSYSRALRFAGRTEEAKKEAETVERLRKDHQEMNDIRRAIVEKPNDLEIRLRAAKWLLDHGHDAEGLEWTQLTLKEHPGHPATCRMLEEYYRRKGNAGLANYYKLAAKPQ